MGKVVITIYLRPPPLPTPSSSLWCGQVLPASGTDRSVVVAMSAPLPLLAFQGEQKKKPPNFLILRFQKRTELRKVLADEHASFVCFLNQSWFW